MIRNSIKKVVCLSVLTCSILVANTQPEIGTVLKEVQVPKEVQEKKRSDIIPLKGIKEYKPLSKKEMGEKKFIKGFIFKDNFNYPNEELQKLIAQFNNKQLSFNDIKNVASVITKAYRDKGYFVARAYIPSQTMENDEVTIAIVEGQYGNFRLTNNSNVHDTLVQGFLDNTKIDGSVRTASVNKATLEKTLLLINDLPGVEITKADVKAGDKLGTSDFDVEASKDVIYDGYVITDNYGSLYTGKERLMAGINFNSLFNYADKLHLNGLVSNGKELTSGGIAYSFPMNYKGLRGTLAYSDTSYSLGDTYSDLDAKGNSKAISFEMSYPLLRTRLENLYFLGGITQNKLKDEIGSTNDITEKNSDVLHIALDYDKSNVLFDFENQFKTNVKFTYGNLEFNDIDDENDDRTSVNTVGKYSKINLEISNDIYFNPIISWSNNLNYQHTLKKKNLDGSEDFSIGGAYGVKVYPSGELSAENGFLFNSEVKFQMPSYKGISSQIGIFYDIGRTYMTNNTVGFNDRTLQDAGVGYYAQYKSFFANFQAAYTIDNEDIESEPNHSYKYLVLIGWSFDFYDSRKNNNLN